MIILEPVGAKTAQTSLISVPPLPQCKVSVIVPAKDEAQTIVATLTALANQTDLHGQPLNPLTYEIIVLANNCSDESAAIARQFAQQHPDLVLHIAEVTLPPEGRGKAGSCVSSERRGKPTRADLSAYNIINHDGGH
jgi:glycosyltransferase involved in cell wall biosynthesis